MEDYKFGTFVFLPQGELAKLTYKLREEYDPVSARTSPAHITITQPFSIQPNADQLKSIETLLGQIPSFEIEIGPVVSSPNKRLIWFDVKEKSEVLFVREKLHELKLFRTDLPLTKGFLPHMTISEKGREPEEVNSIIDTLNQTLQTWKIKFDSISWIVPDQNFVFHERRKFHLK